MILSAFLPRESKYVWLQYKRPGASKKQYHKTAVLKTDPERERKVALAINEMERKLLQAAGAAAAAADHGAADAGSWRWVERWARMRYSARQQEATLTQVIRRWRWLEEFLVESDIACPAELERADCFDYLEWRTSQVKEKSRKHPSKNTALQELKLLGMIMEEAVGRGYATSNPARKLGVQRDETELKPEITPEEHGQIMAALAAKPNWMRLAYELAWHTGLRFASTRLERSAVRLQDRLVQIERPKGGRKKAFSIPITESIRPLLEEFLASGRRHLWDPPQGRNEKPRGVQWREFFEGLGLGHLCFHCTRVSYITRGCRAGVPESAMMKLVNHASREISRIYQRWSGADVAEFARLLEGPPRSVSAARAGSPAGKASRRKGAGPAPSRPGRRRS